MNSTMTRPAALWTDANRDEIDQENRMACADERAAYERHELLVEVAGNAANSLRECLKPWAYEVTRTEQLAEWRSALAKLTSDPLPTGYVELIAWCDRLVRDHDEAAA